MFLHVRLPLVTWAQESLQYFPKPLTENEWSEPLYRIGIQGNLPFSYPDPPHNENQRLWKTLKFYRNSLAVEYNIATSSDWLIG